MLYSTAPAALSLPRAMPADLPGLHRGGGLEERLVRLHRIRNRHGAEPIKVEALDIRHGVKSWPSTAFTASKWACVTPWITFGSMARPASRRALMPALLAGVFVTYLSSTPVEAQSIFWSMG